MTLEKIYNSFSNGIRSAKAIKPNEYLQNLGLNYESVEVAFSSGQIHHRKEAKYVSELKLLGLLRPPKIKWVAGKEAHNVFGDYALIFPLKDVNDKIVNLYAMSIKKEKREYLNKAEGLYPPYPDVTTKKLYIVNDIVECATILQSGVLENKERVIALHEGVLANEHIEAINRIAELEQIVCIGISDENFAKLKKNTNENSLLAINLPDNQTINNVFVNGGKEGIVKLLPNSKQETKAHFIQSEIAEMRLAFSLDLSNPDLITYRTEKLLFTIIGGINTDTIERFKIVLKIDNVENSANLFRNGIDLNNSTLVDKVIRSIAFQLKQTNSSVKAIFSDFINQLDEYRFNQLTGNTGVQSEVEAGYKEKGKQALKRADLMEFTNKSIGETGVIGLENERLLLFMCYVSRMLNKPLHAYCMGGTGSGKTNLIKKVAELIPEEQLEVLTSISKNSIYYYEENYLKNKVLLIEDLDGAESADFPIRELQSNGKVVRLITKKNKKGQIESVKQTVNGQVSIVGATTRTSLYPDNENRCFLINVVNTPEQTEAIMQYQRLLSAGKVDFDVQIKVKNLFQNMQRMLKPITVRNPFAEKICIPASFPNAIRTNANILALINVITFYHQYQRQQKVDSNSGEIYIESTIEDINWAMELLKPILLNKADDLAFVYRTFLERIKKYLNENKQDTFLGSETYNKGLIPNKMAASRYLGELSKKGYLEITAGNSKAGFEYRISEGDKYNEIKSMITEVEKSIKKLAV